MLTSRVVILSALRGLSLLWVFLALGLCAPEPIDAGTAGAGIVKSYEAPR